MTQYPESLFSGKAGMLDVPPALREMAEQGVNQARETYEKFKQAAENANDSMEALYGAATRNANDVSMKMVEIARDNTNAAFDLANRLIGVRSFPEAVELLSDHGRKQFEVLTAQAQALAELGQKLTSEAIDPIKSAAEKALKTGK